MGIVTIDALDMIGRRDSEVLSSCVHVRRILHRMPVLLGKFGFDIGRRDIAVVTAETVVLFERKVEQLLTTLRIVHMVTILAGILLHAGE